MNEQVDWDQVARFLDDLYTASDGLEQMFPGRKFTLDGHLVGSIGEVVAAYIFDLDLKPYSSSRSYSSSLSGSVSCRHAKPGRAPSLRHDARRLR